MYEGDVLCLAGVRRPTVSSTVGLLSHLQVASAIEALTSLTDLRLQHSKFKAQATIVASLFPGIRVVAGPREHRSLPSLVKFMCMASSVLLRSGQVHEPLSGHGPSSKTRSSRRQPPLCLHLSLGSAWSLGHESR